MKRFPSIKKNSDFQTIYKSAKSHANRQLVMYVKKTDTDTHRIGISVSKKVGNSVVRHHVTRLIRESFRLHKNTLIPGLDIVVVARPAAKESDYKTIERAYLHLCGLHNILKESKWDYDKKIIHPSYPRLSDIPVAVKDKDSLHLHTYVFPIRHWGTAKVWCGERTMVVHQEDTTVSSMGRRRLWPSSVTYEEVTDWIT